MKRLICALGILFAFACSKTEVPAIPPVVVVQEEAIKFTVTPEIPSGGLNLSNDTLNLNISVSSKLTTSGLLYSIEVKRDDNSLTTFKFDTTSTQNTINIKATGFTIKASYSVNIIVTSKSSPINLLSQIFVINRGRIYKNYLKTSTELYKYDSWFSSDSLFDNGIKYIKGTPLLVMQTAQLDINGDGLEDLITYDDYYTSPLPIPNPPPSIFINNGNSLNKTNWTGPTLRNAHGVKILVGDFNNDSLPDIFSNVAVDLPNGAFPNLLDFNHLIFNSPNGFKIVKEFDDQLGFWYSSCSGDIDKDGDLDIIMFNFHVQSNGVKNKILWNDGKGNFTYDVNGIGDIAVVDQSELIDINNDGYLDLVLDYVTIIPNRVPHSTILWGNGKIFSLSNSVSFDLPSDQFLNNICFADLDSDNFQEIILGGNDGTKFFIEVYKSDDKGKSFVNKTSQYVDNNISLKRFDHIRVQDIDKNGRLDIFAPDKKDNIRWEWSGSKFIKK